MKDIPLFTTQYGAASLTLREIPYRGDAYVKIQATQDPKLLVEECVAFCRAVGAENVYASGHDALDAYTFHTSIIKMSCARESIPETDAALWPVQESTLGIWLEIYNRKSANIPNAAWMSAQDGKRMLEQAEGYFVHRDDKLLGIGRVSSNELRWIASCQQGAGADVVSALCHAVFEDTVTLQVSSENGKALALYNKLGFIPCGEVSRWYKIF